eukprot:9439090-Ditylum_brightwellii.AAC.1
MTNVSVLPYSRFKSSCSITRDAPSNGPISHFTRTITRNSHQDTSSRIHIGTDLACTHGAELTGILSALYLLQALAEYKKMLIMQKQELYCDNIAAVHRANTPLEPGIWACVEAAYDITQKISDTKEAGIRLSTV